jgi:hypothetical protein
MKNYENLVEALTNNAINAACASSLNPTLSLRNHHRHSTYVQIIKVIYSENKTQDIIIIVKAILLIDVITAVLTASVTE